MTVDTLFIRHSKLPIQGLVSVEKQGTTSEVDFSTEFRAKNFAKSILDLGGMITDYINVKVTGTTCFLAAKLSTIKDPLKHVMQRWHGNQQPEVYTMSYLDEMDPEAREIIQDELEEVTYNSATGEIESIKKAAEMQNVTVEEVDFSNEFAANNFAKSILNLGGIITDYINVEVVDARCILTSKPSLRRGNPPTPPLKHVLQRWLVNPQNEPLTGRESVFSDSDVSMVGTPTSPSTSESEIDSPMTLDSDNELVADVFYV